MNKAGLVILIWFAFVLQTVVFSTFFMNLSNFFGLSLLQGRTIEVPLAILLYLAFHRSFFRAMFWGLVFCLIASSFGFAWKGSSITAYLLIVVVGSILRKKLRIEGFEGVAVLILFFSLLYGLYHLFSAYFYGQIPSAFQGHILALITQVVLNTLVCPLVYYLILKFDEKTGGHIAIERGSYLLGGPRHGYPTH